MVRDLGLYLIGKLFSLNWLLDFTSNSVRVSVPSPHIPSLFRSYVSISVSSQWLPFVTFPFHICVFLFHSIGRRSFLQIVNHDVDQSWALQNTSLKLGAVVSQGEPCSYEKAEPLGFSSDRHFHVTTTEQRLSVAILGILNFTRLQMSAHSDFQPVLLLGCL